MGKRLLTVAALLLSGCAHQPPFGESAGHLTQPAAPPPAGQIPPPVTVNAYVPPPKPAPKPQTYSVVVNEVPAKELLFAMARDTKLNIDIHPGIRGVVTLNAINETLPAILDRIAEQVSIRYKLDGDTLVVMPDTPYIDTYHVNYVNLDRNTTSSIGVSTQIAATGSSAQTTGTQQAAAGGGNSSSTTVTSTSNNNFWEVLTENIRRIIRSTNSAALSAEERAAREEVLRTAQTSRLQQAEAVARAGAGAATLFNTAFGSSGSGQADDAKNDVIVNPVAGTVTVLATQRQHKLIRQYLDSVQTAAQRQVLIEATIVEVTLKDQYKAGVDWSRIASGTGFSFNTNPAAATNLANSLNPYFAIGYGNANANFNVTLNLLQSFGKTRVLSSPKIMALNNQTALLKVVDNVVYFSIQVQQGTTSSSGIVTQPTYSTTAHTVPVGVVMSVTPQVNSDGMVSLTVRPTISRIVDFKNDPNPALVVNGTQIKNPVPEIQVREMESVLQIESGQTVILGGLMQDDRSRDRDSIPGLGDIPGVGAVFGQREDQAKQTELVIFLRPTIISKPSLASDELKFFRRYLPQAPAQTEPAPAGKDSVTP